ncbi:tocopherol cyclase family protein [Clostridium sp. 'White wine YQ']|uniref:tocopherol cyclase family protein n=1 Tax=Clostridium sp. 'White wine YQ' TaxID=3027474 RepID=UPI002364FCF8|nr:tocopherol cyclase family protein [Clostridium sp. 'White wine YQ']MDD7793601.1 tocopherol cyclase family protein [Clostridium sp. 'White wine YQ']
MFRKINNPIIFQGSYKKKHYFEGWYFKQISRDGKFVICIIPGVSLFHNDYHSFIQYIFIRLDKKRIIRSGYIRYPLNAFKFRDTPFMIQIGDNVFTESIISLNMKDKKIKIQGTLKLGALTEIEKSILNPNIMGYFAYIPKMECYHGIISMNHKLNGILAVNRKIIDFTKGKGYIEKDWGTSFPKEYIWIQCNNFKNQTTSFICSIANIPFLHTSFNGLICNICINGVEYRFATYNNSKAKIERITKSKINISIENNKALLKVEASLSSTGVLIAPQKGKMDKNINEELLGKLKLQLFDKKNNSNYIDFGTLAGIEVVGY